MTYKISLEALGQIGPDGFAAMVASHIAALQEYDAHMVLVRRDAELADLPDEEHHTAFPPPHAPVEVESAIKRTPKPDGTTTFEPNYEIVPPSIEQRKERLFAQVSAAEQDAIRTVVPAGKIRAFQFREQDIRKADQARIMAEYAARAAAGDKTQVDSDKFQNEHRPAADTRFMEEQAAREDQRNEIQRWAANLHSDIEDLTADTIDAWEMKPFHG
jgi:hypothetical protein